MDLTKAYPITETLATARKVYLNETLNVASPLLLEVSEANPEYAAFAVTFIGYPVIGFPFVSVIYDCS